MVMVKVVLITVTFDENEFNKVTMTMQQNAYVF